MEIAMADQERGPKGASRVASCGLDPDVFENALPQQEPVGDAIECHTTGHHEVLAAN